ncbi:MAG: L,D-transpeptidase family protein [Alphaproteobacteria bacterium]|nr:L,D-transpeptidase family protein [Alphaproteobacteria bacterium]
MKKLFKFSFIFFASATFFNAAAHAAYDKPYVGDMTEYRADYEDTFVHIARDYKLGYVEMRAANPGVDPWIPGSGKKLILPTRNILPDAPRKGVVINVPEMRLYYFDGSDNPPFSYPIGIGREGLDTPLGKTTVVRKVEGPVWTPTPRMRREKPELPPFEPPGPNNPMGTHALYLGFPQVAIHGTNRAFGIGRRISSGCIRLYPEDIIALYNQVPVGTQVTVVDQPIKLAWIDNELYIEAHPEVEYSIQMEETGEIPPPKLKQEDMERILRAAGEFKDRLNWPAIRTAVKERRGYPVPIARRPRVEISEAEIAPQEPAIVRAEKKQIRQEAAAALKEMFEEEETKEAQSALPGKNSRTANP